MHELFTDQRGVPLKQVNLLIALRLQVGVNAKGRRVLNKLELAFQRNTLVETITLPRAAASAAPTEEDMASLLENVYFEQTCKVRKTIAPRGHGHDKERTHIVKEILLRLQFYQYLKQMF